MADKNLATRFHPIADKATNPTTNPSDRKFFGFRFNDLPRSRKFPARNFSLRRFLELVFIPRKGFADGKAIEERRADLPFCLFSTVFVRVFFNNEPPTWRLGAG